MDKIQRLSTDLKLDKSRAEPAVVLLIQEYSVPFIARYRKERCGGLDEQTLYALQERLKQLNELEQRRIVVLKSISDAGKMTPELQKKIDEAETRTELEDLFIPYRSRRRVRSSAARQKGLEPLADVIWKQETSPKVPELPKAPPPTAEVKASTEPAKAPEEKQETPAAAAPAETKSETPAEKTERAEGSPASAAAPATDITNSVVEELVKPFVAAGKEVKDIHDALSGARDIIAERVTENAACRRIARELLLAEGTIVTKSRDGTDAAKGKYSAVAKLSEPLAKIQNHKLLTAMRAAAEKQISLSIEAPRDKILSALKEKLVTNPDAPLKAELVLAIEEGYDRLLGPSLDNELRLELKRRTDLKAIEVFSKNLQAMLLAPPLGEKPVMGIVLRPRGGSRIAVVDAKGKIVAHASFSLDKPRAAPAEKAKKPAPAEAAATAPAASDAAALEAPKEEAKKEAEPIAAPPAPAAEAPSAGTPGNPERQKAAELIAKLIQEHNVCAIAYASGSGGRDVESLVRELVKSGDIKDIVRIPTSEAGVTAFANSAAGREENSDADVAVREAAILARRVQDPLAELCKSDPRTLNLGQYQHDVDQDLLKEKLGEVVESCVNRVCADANRAESAVLEHIAGITTALARNIVAARKASGGFKSRADFGSIADTLPKDIEQASPFLRIVNGSNPLDQTGVHPEAYAAAEAMAASLNVPVKDLLGNAELIGKLEPAKFKTEQLSENAIKDVIQELKAGGRDPRGPFVKPEFNEQVSDIKDLKEGMVLGGIVSNLTPFGAFVDIGVHQEGLVHLSAITHKFIRDPSEALALGQHVKVKVLSVDTERRRISLSIKALEAPPQQRPARPAAPRPPRPPRPAQAAGSATTAPSGAGSAQGRPDRPRRDSRPPRSPRPQPAGTPGAPAASAPAGSVVASSVTSGSPTHGTDNARREPRSRNDTTRRSGAPGERRGGPPGDRRPPPQKAKVPGAPDYSKFFVKKKPKERERKKTDNSAAASREEVRQIIRSQQGGGTTLGDLLRQAGVKEE